MIDLKKYNNALSEMICYFFLVEHTKPRKQLVGFFFNHDMLNYCSQFTAKDLVFCCTSTEFWHREEYVKHEFSFLFFFAMSSLQIA